MVKPHEETWRLGPGGLGLEHLREVDGEEEWCQFGSLDGPQAELAACAPEMARLLLELEFVDTSDGEYAERCPSCQGRERLPPDGRAGLPFRPLPAGKHAADCKLDALLRKAGLR